MRECMRKWVTELPTHWINDILMDGMNQWTNYITGLSERFKGNSLDKYIRPSASQINSCIDLQYRNAEWLMRYVNTLKLSLEVVHVTDRWTICLTWRIICNTSERFNTSWWGDLDKLLKKIYITDQSTYYLHDWMKQLKWIPTFYSTFQRRLIHTRFPHDLTLACELANRSIISTLIQDWQFDGVGVNLYIWNS